MNSKSASKPASPSSSSPSSSLAAADAPSAAEPPAVRPGHKDQCLPTVMSDATLSVPSPALAKNDRPAGTTSPQFARFEDVPVKQRAMFAALQAGTPRRLLLAEDRQLPPEFKMSFVDQERDLDGVQPEKPKSVNTEIDQRSKPLEKTDIRLSIKTNSFHQIIENKNPYTISFQSEPASLEIQEKARAAFDEIADYRRQLLLRKIPLTDTDVQVLATEMLARAGYFLNSLGVEFSLIRCEEGNPQPRIMIKGGERTPANKFVSEFQKDHPNFCMIYLPEYLILTGATSVWYAPLEYLLIGDHNVQQILDPPSDDSVFVHEMAHASTTYLEHRGGESPYLGRGQSNDGAAPLPTGLLSSYQHNQSFDEVNAYQTQLSMLLRKKIGAYVHDQPDFTAFELQQVVTQLVGVSARVIAITSQAEKQLAVGGEVTIGRDVQQQRVTGALWRNNQPQQESKKPSELSDKNRDYTVILNQKDESLAGHAFFTAYANILNRHVVERTHAAEAGKVTASEVGKSVEQLAIHLLAVLQRVDMSPDDAMLLVQGEGAMSLTSVLNGIRGSLAAGDFENVRALLGHLQPQQRFREDLTEQLNLRSHQSQLAWSKKAAFQYLNYGRTCQKVIDSIEQLQDPAERLLMLQALEEGIGDRSIDTDRHAEVMTERDLLTSYNNIVARMWSEQAQK
jgi:hypothetical protein